MKLSKPVISKLSEMICGNHPLSHFPYRSSSFLTKFFFDIDLEYIHDGSTRALWVQSILEELNKKEPINERLPSREICKVLSALVNPDYFLFDEKLNLERALSDVNKLIKNQGLVLKKTSDGQYIVSSSKGELISTESHEGHAEKQIVFVPSVFKIPNKDVNDNLVSVMMPFSPLYRGTYEAIRKVTIHMGLECLRADDIWTNSTFIQDIFELIYCSKIVIVDFSERNPNVMYETGIAHTLGKVVIPITQSLNDIPSDLNHHRALKYLANEEGYRDLSNGLYKRIKSILKL